MKSSVRPIVRARIPARSCARTCFRPCESRRRKSPRLLGVSRQTLYDILAEKNPVTPAMALRIGKLTGTTAQSWLAMQQAFDLWHAERELRQALKQIPTLEAAA